MFQSLAPGLFAMDEQEAVALAQSLLRTLVLTQKSKIIGIQKSQWHADEWFVTYSVEGETRPGIVIVDEKLRSARFYGPDDQ